MVASRIGDARDPAVVAQRAYCRSLRDAMHSIPAAAPAGNELRDDRRIGRG